jgi:hypothetical protein
MKARDISCTGCGRSWLLDETPSLYRELVLETQPCPACEAYTLSCPEAEDADLFRHPRGARRRGRPPDLASPGSPSAECSRPS